MTSLAPVLRSVETPLLQVESVSCQFPQASSPAVFQVSFSLPSSDILGLLGPSGCGKTTLLRLVAGFEPIQSGCITLAGQRVAGQGQWMAPERRDIGMVFQDYALFPHLNVAQNVSFGLSSRTARTPSDKTAELVRQTLALVGLKGLEHRFPHELSGGQQQRVALARALAPRPTLLLLDEPLSNLDIQVRLHLRREIREILKATHTTAIFVTHDQEEALALCDRVAVMRHGQIEQLADPETLYRQPRSRFVAEFVTQANFLAAQRRNHHWQTEVGTFAVPPHAVSHDLPTDSGEIMIRQEDLMLQSNPDGNLVVRDRHFLGRDYRYWVQTPSGQLLQARLLSGAIAVGERVNGVVSPDLIRVFPRVT